ncbi:pheromone-processing carboxypeptidase KEX1, partial [Biomphalaria glabrata]
MKRSKKDGDNGNMQKQVLNEIHEENVEYKWANGKSCTVFHGNNLTLKDLITDEQIPNRFFFRLKLLPTSVSSYRLKPLVHNFLKCISFEDCVLVELNDQVAYLFWSELVPLKTSVTGIIQLKNIEEKFRVDNDENEYHQTSNKSYNKYSPKQKRIFPKDAKDNNSLAYSYFKRLIVTQDLRNVNLDLPKGCFVCDIILLQNKSQRNTEIKLAYPTINILPPDVSTAVIGNDELCISFKDACNKTKLRKKIFNEILKHYNLSSSSIEVCYLMFHLNIKEATFDSQNWNAQELQCLIRQCIRYCKPNILIELIDNYKPATSIWNELRNSVTQLSLIEIFSSDNLS